MIIIDSDLDKMRTFCSNDFVCQRNFDSSTSDQVGERAEFHSHRDAQRIVHPYHRIVSQEYVLFCDWLAATGYSGLCTSFQSHLDSERVASRYHSCPVAHPQDKESVDSSILLSVGCVRNLHIPVEDSDYAQGDAHTPSHSRQVGGGKNLWLSQGDSIPPYLHA